MSIARIRVEWSGDAITGPGLTTLFATTATSSWVTGVIGLVTSWRASMPAGVTWVVPNSGDLINELTGELTGTWNEGTGAIIAGSTAGAYARGVGARIAWGTSRIYRGRRVRGSTYVLPLKSTAYDADGTITAAVLADLNAGAQAYIASDLYDPVVWSRPGAGHPGTVSPIETSLVKDQVSWLRSRRT